MRVLQETELRYYFRTIQGEKNSERNASDIRRHPVRRAGDSSAGTQTKLLIFLTVDNDTEITPSRLHRK